MVFRTLQSSSVLFFSTRWNVFRDRKVQIIGRFLRVRLVSCLFSHSLKSGQGQSQLCHCCGARKDDLQLSDRVFVCPNLDCHYVGDRDENAALNLIGEALRLFGLNLNMPSQRVATAGRKTACGPGVRPKGGYVPSEASGNEPGRIKGVR